MTPTTSMRVLHWCPHFPIGGGITSSVLALCDAQRRCGADALIAAPAADGSQLFELEVGTSGREVFFWKPWRSLRLGNMVYRPMARRTVRSVQALEPDVVHVHAEFSVDNLRIPRLFDCPVVLSPHGAFHPAVLESSVLRNKALYARVARALFYKHVAAFHALTPKEQLDIGTMVPRASVYCVPQGSTLPAPSGTEGRCDDPSTGVTLLFLGRIDVYTKALDVLLAAFGRAVRQLPQAGLFLRLVGPGSDEARRVLEAQARNLGIDDRVEMPGTASRQDVADLLDTSTLYVQLSRHEGLSVSVCEALVAGIPAVLSVEACPFDEIAALEHVTVVEPEPEQAAAAIVASVANLELQRAAARETLPYVHEFFSWQRIAEEHLSRYAELVRERAEVVLRLNDRPLVP